MSAPGFKDDLSPYEELREQLRSQLPDYLVGQRWFGSKARKIRQVDVADMVPFPAGRFEAWGLLVRVEYHDGSPETYALPVLPRRAENLAGAQDDPSVLKIRLGADRQDWILSDALRDDEFLQGLLVAVEASDTMRGIHGEVRASHTGRFSELHSFPREILCAKVLKGEQSNSSVVYGDRFILKIFRRVVEGVNPDLEIGMFLTEKAHSPSVPPLAGWLEYQASGGKPATLAILQGFAPNQGDAWSFTLQSLARFWRDVSQTAADSPAQANGPVARGLTEKNIPPAAWKSVDEYLDAVRLLARRTAELHLALASDNSDPEFAPEPFTESFRRELESSARELAQRNLALLRSKAEALPQETRGKAEKILGREADILDQLQGALSKKIRADRTRIHGDYHLGQVLFTGSDFVIIDFEGEPARSLIERRKKRSPLQDVAGMLRSFHYAAHSSLLDHARSKPNAEENMPELLELADHWYELVSGVFFEGYLQESKGACYLPPDRSEISKLLEFHLLEKAIYELGYELNNRPSWVGIPLSGIAALLDLGHGDSRDSDSRPKGGVR